MIPKTIHSIWFGDNKIPDQCVGYIDKIKSMYQDFEHVMWTKYDDSKITDDLMYKCPNLGAATDIARLEILYEFGGVYFDVDVQPLKKANWMLEYPVWGVKQNAGVANCIIGAEKKSPAILDILESLNRVRGRIESLKVHDTKSVTGPEMVSRVFCSRSDVTVFGKNIWENYFTHHQLQTWVRPLSTIPYTQKCCTRTKKEINM